ncbi:P2X purinoceptor 4-like [Haemaphysalis longicornis]
MGYFAALEAIRAWILSELSAFFFEYETLKVVQIGSKKIGLFNRALQMVIMCFVLGYAMLFERGHQHFTSCTSASAVKVKGAVSTEFLPDEALDPAVADARWYRKVWDAEDVIVPPHATDKFFVTTNVVVMPNQTRGHCPEDPNLMHAWCHPDSNVTSCTRGVFVSRGNGVMTGRCVMASPPEEDRHVCEISGWCPVQRNVNALRNGSALLAGVRDFTVLIRNYVEFSSFGVRRRNIAEHTQLSDLKSCVYNAKESPLCPIFRIGDMVEQAGADFDQMARKGGVIEIMINWDCDLDYDVKHCLPKYSFHRLDDAANAVAEGVNFRYSKHENETTRTLVKAYGINFVVIVQCRAGKTSLVSIAVTLGSGLGLLVVATVLCDFLVVYVDKRRNVYKSKKIKVVAKEDERKGQIRLVHHQNGMQIRRQELNDRIENKLKDKHV